MNRNYTKKAGLLFATMLSMSTLQAQDFEWAFEAKNVLPEQIVKDQNDNIYSVGYYFSTGSIAGRTNSAMLTLNGFMGGYLVKYNKEGNIVWTKTLSGTNMDQFYSVHYDGAGNIYAAGMFSASVTLEPGHTLQSAGRNDVVVVKYDTAGNLKWATRIGGDRDDVAYAVTTDGTGNVLVGGTFINKVDFNPSVLPQDTFFMTSTGAANTIGGFVLKLNSAGSFVWAKQFTSESGTGLIQVKKLVADAAGNVFVGGNWRNGRLDLNPGTAPADTFMLPAASRGFDVYIAKLGPAGNFLAGGSYGGRNQDDPPYMMLDKTGNLYLTGAFHDTVDFNLSRLPQDTAILHTLQTEPDAYVWAMDNDLKFKWVKNVAAGWYPNEGRHISLDPAGDLFVTGRFRGIDVDFNPGPDTFKLSSNGAMGTDVFFLRLTTGGQFKWAGSLYGTTSQDFSTGMLPLSNGDLLGFGTTNGRTDLDPGPDTFYLNATGDVTYMMKLTYRSTVYDTITGCDSVSLNNQWYRTSGDYTQRLTNRYGVDSLVHLHVTIRNSSAPQSITRTACDSFTLDGMHYYTVSGSYPVRFTNAAGCDSVVNLNLTVYKTDTLLSVTACGSYTLNGQIYTATGDYVQTRTGSGGCDSTIRLELEIKELPDSSVIRNGNVLTAAQGGAAYQWIHCDTRQPVSGATGQTFIPQANGGYAVAVTRNGCSDTSGCEVITDASSVAWLTADQQIRIYPNPSSGIFVLQASGVSGSLVVTDMQGRTAWSGQISNQDREIKIDLQTQPAGVYLLKGTDVSGTTFRSLMIKK